MQHPGQEVRQERVGERRAGGRQADLIRQIEELALDESVVIARRAKTSGQPIRLFVPLTHATLQDKRLAEQFVALLDANRAIGDSLVFAIPQPSFKLLGPQEKMVLQQLSRIGIADVLGRLDILEVGEAPEERDGSRDVGSPYAIGAVLLFAISTSSFTERAFTAG